MAPTSWFLFVLARSYGDELNYNWNTMYSARKYHCDYQSNVKRRIFFKYTSTFSFSNATGSSSNTGRSKIKQDEWRIIFLETNKN